MEGFSSGDSVSIVQYANKLQSLIKSIDNKNIRGWILDLRNNTGGNCWPMLAGLGPLLSNGICGYFIDSKQNKSGWYYNNGAAGVDSITKTRVSIEPYSLIKKESQIAVLTGPKTASSGEVVVTSFREKANTKSFGESTSGLSTGNTNYQLSDGSMILLTTSIYADRQGNLYGGKIVPDSLVIFSYDAIGTNNDQVIKAALDWIYKQ
jgi:C-terminal processing protease CtpA/Prc